MESPEGRLKTLGLWCKRRLWNNKGKRTNTPPLCPLTLCLPQKGGTAHHDASCSVPNELPLARGVAFRLDHGGDVEPEGNCPFTEMRRTMGPKAVRSRELRQLAMRWFLEDYG
ncbi:hypothetical protein GW17_00057234 [Ensete ventricosum]|nr:hypothetical protein GW17_00057234 [Ensete ventricosum]